MTLAIDCNAYSRIAMYYILFNAKMLSQTYLNLCILMEHMYTQKIFHDDAVLSFRAFCCENSGYFLCCTVYYV